MPVTFFASWGRAAAALAAAVLIPAAAPAEESRWQPLREDPRVNNELLIAVIGAHIVETCPDIRQRELAAMGFLLGLAHHAMSLGYSRDEIEEFYDDPVERRHYIGLARRYFAERGVTSDTDVEGACRVGRDEIATGSPIGRLLREG